MHVQPFAGNPWDCCRLDGSSSEEDDRTTVGGSSSSRRSSASSRSSSPGSERWADAAGSRAGSPRDGSATLLAAVPAATTGAIRSSVDTTSSPATAASTLRANEGAHPDSTTMTMVHCLFAVAFAALVLGGLTFLGVVVQSTASCPSAPGYSWCAMGQDFRSVLSFLLGAVLCWLFTHGKERAAPLFAPPERSEKVQLYAYML